MDILINSYDLIRNLFSVWMPFLLVIAPVFAAAIHGPKIVRTARTNARIRAERAARNAYRAPVIDLTKRLPQHPGTHTA